MYSVGSKVVHALHGLGTVETIEEKDILGQIARFSVISFQNDRLKIMVNVDQRNNMIRPLTESSDIPKVLDYMKSVTCEMPSKSSERYAINLRKVKSADVYQLAEVVKDLMDLSREKKLSPKELAMLKQARGILSSEMGQVLSKSIEEMESSIDVACRREELVTA
jgi:CarD family transcriptional regulator